MQVPVNNWTNMSYNKIYRILRHTKIKERRASSNLPSSVSELVTEDGCKVYLVGTVHYSRKSAEDVEQVIQSVQPDAVVVELCEERNLLLTLDKQILLRDIEMLKIYRILPLMKQLGVSTTLWFVLLLKISAILAKEMGVFPGEEFRRAFREAQKVPCCSFYLGDRPLLITLKRCTAAFSMWDVVKILHSLCRTLQPGAIRLDNEMMEQIKEKDVLDQTLKLMKRLNPELYHVFVSERDIYLTQSLKNAAKPIVLPAISPSDPQQIVPSVAVGVVGIGHVAGIKNNWNKQLNTQELLRLPKPSLLSRGFQVTSVVALYGLKIFFYYKVAQILIWLFY